jgi:hypothetical protein
VLIFAGWVIVAIMHIDDRYEVGHGQGAWMALAHHANVAGLYPELFDGTSYGGTRHMPVTILLHAAVARATGEYVTSGKLVGLLATSGLMIAVFCLLRNLGCRWSWALALTASALGGAAGLRAGVTIGGEPLPVLFGVGALIVVIHSRRNLSLVVAAVLVALGVSAKFSALWAPAAIVTWLLLVEPRRAAVFAICATVASAALLGAFNVVSGGRMVENLFATSGAGIYGAVGLLKAPARLLGYLVDGESGLWAFVPVLGYAAATKRWPVEVAVLPLAWIVAAGLLIIIYSDIGTGPNQLIDLAILTSLCVGALVAFADFNDARDKVLVMVVGAILVWTNITAFSVRIRPPLQEAIGALTDGRDPYPRNVLAEHLFANESVLSEDPGILVQLGRTPVVFDAFMLRRLAQKRPATVRPLVGRLERHEFQLIVLVVKLDSKDDVWWRDYDFGTDVISAMDHAYQFEQRIGPYYLYTPRP